MWSRPVAAPPDSDSDQGTGINFTRSDFSNAEDALPWWEAIAVYGGLLLGSGAAVAVALRGGPLTGPPDPFPVLVLFIVLVLSGILAAVLGFGEVAIALFGAAFTAGAAAVLVPPIAVIAGLIPVGAVLLVLGVAFSLRSLAEMRQESRELPTPVGH